MKIFSDIQTAIKRLWADRGFSLTVVAIMAVGIGLCTYMYAFLNTIAFKPLPFVDGERIVSISSVIHGHPVAAPSLDYVDYRALKEGNRSFASMGAFSEGPVTLGGSDVARRFNGARVEADMIDFTGVQPQLGRGFTDADNIEGAPPTVLLSHDIWQAQFGGETNIVGRFIDLDGRQTEVVGIMPKDFSFPRNSDLWMPLQQHQLVRGQGLRVASYAKLKDGVTVEEANRDVGLIMSRLENAFPETNASIGAFVSTFQIAAIGSGILKFILVMALVVFLTLVLLFVNLGNLLLARTAQYARDTAIRMALGAPRRSIMTLMVSESALLSLLGCLSGLAMAAFALQLTGPVTASFIGGKPYYWWQFSLDWQTLSIVALLLVIAVLVTGFLPAWRALRENINQVLRDGSRGGVSRKVARINATLVVLEVFLSTSILIVAVLLGFSTLQATTVDYGAKTQGFMTARIDLEKQYPTLQAQHAFWLDLTNAMRDSGLGSNPIVISSLPGVWSYQGQIEIEGKENDGWRYPVANTIVSLPGSLENLSVALIEGRLLDSRDKQDALPVAVVTRRFAEQHWPQESAVGKRFKLRSDNGSDWVTVVGIVNDVLHGQPYSDTAKAPTAYLPAGQRRSASMSLAVHFEGAENQFKQRLRERVAALNSAVAVYDVKGYEKLLQQNTAGLTFISSIFAIFGLVSLLLAATGIFGVMANTTLKQTQEIGIRRALGATHGLIRRLYLIRGGRQLIAGLVLALLASAYAVQPLVGTFQPSELAIVSSFFLVLLIITVVVISAILIPLIAILQVQPNKALRSE